MATSGTYLLPSEMRFTQDSVGEYFRSGSHLVEVFQQLVMGDLFVEDMEPIACVLMNDSFWVIHGNRRLLLYKKLEKAGIIHEVFVIVKPFIPEFFWRRFTTRNQGKWVECRGNPNLNLEMSQVLYDALGEEEYDCDDDDFWHIYEEEEHDQEDADDYDEEEESYDYDNDHFWRHYNKNEEYYEEDTQDCDKEDEYYDEDDYDENFDTYKTYVFGKSQRNQKEVGVHEYKLQDAIVDKHLPTEEVSDIKDEPTEYDNFNRVKINPDTTVKEIPKGPSTNNPDMSPSTDMIDSQRQRDLEGESTNIYLGATESAKSSENKKTKKWCIVM